MATRMTRIGCTVNGLKFVATKMIHPYTRLIETKRWAATQDDRREVSILIEDLFWAVEEIEHLRFQLSDSDLEHDLQTESRSWLQEVVE